MKKIMMIMMAVVLVFSMAGQAAADFSTTSLLRVVYDSAGTLESVTDLGTITDKTAPFANNVIYNTNNFSTSQFGGTAFSNLYVAYFAVDGTDKDVYVSGPMASQRSGSAKFSSVQGATTAVINGYNSILGDTEKMGTMAKFVNANTPSYYNKMDLNGANKGSFNAFIPAANGEANLAALATTGYVDQTLYYYDFTSTSSPAKDGVKMAVIRTFADGHTELNPVPVPASVLLLGSGLLGLIGIRRKMAA